MGRSRRKKGSGAVPVGLVFLLGLLVLAIVAACASRAAATLSATYSSGTGLLPSGHVDLTGDEDGDIGMGDSIGVLVYLGGKISLRGKKYQESNIGDSGNTGDGGKTGDGSIGACGGIGDSLAAALYAYIYGSSLKGDMASEAKRYLDKLFEGSGEMFPGETGK
ncbi:hypothetical protein Tco_0814275 [Tanacetum coccineum]